MEILDEKVISDAEAKEILEKRAQERELKLEQRNAQEVIGKFIQTDAESARNLGAELFKIGKLKDRHIAAIINFLPQDKDDLRAVLQKDYALLTEDEANLVLETVKKFI